jgi:putative sterol carrier protein
VAVTEVVEEFLTALADRGYEPLLAKTSGVLAIHLVGGPQRDRWVMAVDKGNVTVGRGGFAADATITLDRSLFERMVQGRANAMAAVLRGAVNIDGDLDLLLAIQRVFPGPNDGGADQGESRL